MVPPAWGVGRLLGWAAARPGRQCFTLAGRHWEPEAQSRGVRSAAPDPCTHSAVLGTERDVCLLLFAHSCSPLARHRRCSSLRSHVVTQRPGVPLTCQSLPDPGPMSGCLQVSHTWGWVGTLWVPLRAEMMMLLLTEPLLLLPLLPHHMLNCRPKDSSLPPTPF